MALNLVQQDRFQHQYTPAHSLRYPSAQVNYTHLSTLTWIIDKQEFTTEGDSSASAENMARILFWKKEILYGCETWTLLADFH